jgi:hypothetical protein
MIAPRWIAVVAALVLTGCATTNQQPSQQISGTLHSLHAPGGGPATGYVVATGGDSGSTASAGTTVVLDVAGVTPSDLTAADGKNVVVTGMPKPDSDRAQFIAQSILVVSK